MPRKPQSRGTCVYCSQEMAKGPMLRHLKTCASRLAAIGKAAGGRGKKPETLYHLRVQDAYAGDFWLDLEMRGENSLQTLDDYLRAIWLECCGHLSQFSIGRGWGQEISMRRRAQNVFEPDVELTHIYDFGTSSETIVRVLDQREGYSATRHPIALMARNKAPEHVCTKCGQPASWLCLECVYDAGEAGTLCDKHARRHPHDNYGDPMRLVNSPRTGMCGYDGPAEPPY